MPYSSLQSIALSSQDATFKNSSIGGGNYNWTTPSNAPPPPPDPNDPPPDPDDPPPPENVSGVWKPIMAGTGLTRYCEPLTFSKSDKSSTFTPCNCNTTDFSDTTEGYYDEIENSTINCSYCTYTGEDIDWYLYAEDGTRSRKLTASDCCDGICDTRLNKDDYLPKIPMLNQGLLSGFVDFKYMNEFPGCNNPGLGIERYITFDGSEVSGILDKKGIKLTNCKLCIDWKMKECMSEIPYNELESQHESQYLHEKSYRRSITTSKTAGNFICLDNLSFSDLPTVEEFNAPYGFNNSSYNNLFYKGKRIGSYWKWNYTEGVMMWQRYFEGNYETFISPGEFFYATMDGPEPFIDTSILVNSTEEEGLVPDDEGETEVDGADDSTGGGGGEAREMTRCPSGLKIVDTDGEISHIFPSGSSFCYVSENIYPLFKEIYNRVIGLSGVSIRRAIDIAGKLATGPQYDNVTLDLFSGSEYSYLRNEFAQISGINEHMNTGMHYGSAFDFSYAKNLDDTIKNLRHKYGQYIWIPPNTDASIELIDYEGSFLEFDYDMVLDKDKIKHSTNNSSQKVNYDNPITGKAFTYHFSIDASEHGQILGCDPDISSIYKETCVVRTGLLDARDPDDPDDDIIWKSGEFSYDSEKFVNYITSDAKGVMILDKRPNEFYDKYARAVLGPIGPDDYCDKCDSKSSYHLAGITRTLCKEDNFCDFTLADYFRGSSVRRKISDTSLVMKRNYYAQALNARIDAIALHPNFGSAVEARMFGLDGKKSFFAINNNNKGDTRSGSITIKFSTNDVGIKIYDIRSVPIQQGKSSITAKRFPVDYNNLCKCDSLLYPQLAGYHPKTLRYVSSSYTPNVSVGRFSPQLDKYGGYSTGYLDKNFPGQGLGLTEGIKLEDLSHRIDPEYPYGKTSQGKSISLPNYHTTEWDFTTSANTITISENADLYGRSWEFFEDEFGDNERMNTNWKRFTTRVEINNEPYYNGQKANIPGNVHIVLVNPFLEALTAGEKKVLHPPTVTGGNHFFDNVWGLFGPRGDEMSSVTLTFKNEQDKDLVYFNTSFMKSDDLELEPKKFDIQYGIELLASEKNYSHINASGLIPFDDLPDLNEIESDTLSFTGKINNSLVRSLQNIYNVDKTKKPKIYIYWNNNLYEYIDNSIDDFIYTLPSQNRTFAGPPLLYEYISNVKSSLDIPYLIPIYRKFQPSLYARYNSITPQHRNIDDNTLFPCKGNTIYKKSSSKIILPGARHYFCIKNNQQIISSNGVSIINVAQLPSDVVSQIYYRALVDFNGQVFMYIGGLYSPEDRRDDRNYVFMPTIESARFFSNYANLSFDLSNDNNASFLTNSDEATDEHDIKMYNFGGSARNCRIISRRILIQYYLDNFKPTKDKTKNFRLFTELTLGQYIPPDYQYLDSINSDNNCSFVFYDRAEYSNHKDQYMLDPYTMYGDLRKYDDNLFNQPIVLSEINIDDLPIPKTQYFNSFYKLILSDLQTSVDFRFFPAGLEDNEDNENNAISITGITNIQYNIPQKYAIDDANLEEQYYLDTYREYENYLGILDVNIFDKTFMGSKNPYIEYKVKSNRLWSNLPDNSPSDGRDFILNLNKNAILVPVSDNLSSVTMYKPGVPFILSKVIRKNNYSTTAPGVQTLASDRDFVNLYNSSQKFNVTTQREYPYLIYDVYDMGNACQGELYDKECNAYRAGSIDLKTEISFPSGTSNGVISVSDLLGQKISIGVGYDNGIGLNFTTNNFYTKIKRGIDFDSYDLCNSKAYAILPQFIYDQKQDNSYWSSVGDLPESARPDIVNKTDKYANEMLFRILYGQKQKHNRERFFYEEEAITYNKLVDVSYDIEAKDLYNEIPYNYDRSAEMANFYLDHSITIYGTGGLGDHVDLTIGDTDIDIDFYGDQGKIVVDIDGQTSTFFLATGGKRETYDYISVPKTAQPPDDVEYVGDINGISDVSYGWRSQRFYTGDPLAVAGCCQVCFGDSLSYCPVGTNLGPEDNIVGSSYNITNYVGGGGVTPKITNVFKSGISYECEDGGTWNCDPVGSCGHYGYGSFAGSSKDVSCLEFADVTDGTVSRYSFESCRTRFNLYGSVGSSISYTSEPNEDEYECPDIEYSYDAGCSNNSRGYIVSIYWGCSGYNLPVNFANTFRDYCEETDENPNPTFLNRNPNAVGLPLQRQPGYDKCGMVSSSNDRGVLDAKVYRVIIPAVNGEYQAPVCPAPLITISYNIDSITITAPGSDNQICRSIPYKKECKKIDLVLPNDDYYITESIQSECDSSRHMPDLVLKNDGKQSFLTRDVTLSYGIGSYRAADINDTPPILWGQDAILQCNRGSGPGYAWAGVGLCGVEDAGPWIGPKGIEDHKGLASTAINEFINRIGTLASVYNTAGSDQPVNFNAEKARWAGNINYVGEVLRGPIGDPTVVFHTEEKTYPKINLDSTDEFTETTIYASVSVPYRIPASVASFIPGPVCPGKYDNDISHPFPDWYGDIVGARKFDSILNELSSPRVFSENFAILNSDFTLGCDGLQTNYNRDILDDTMAIRPCPLTDYACWIKQSWVQTINKNWREI